MTLLTCLSCKEEIRYRSQNPNQKYCSKKQCQNERKRAFKAKKREDPEYRKREQAACQRWRDKNPGYMVEYRKNNLDYVKRNSEQQGERNRRQRRDAEDGASRKGPKRRGRRKADPPPSGSGPVVVIVNSDASNPQIPRRLLDVVQEHVENVIVNSDASNLVLSVVLLPIDITEELLRRASG